MPHPEPVGTAIFRVSVRGAGRAGHQMTELGEDIQIDLEREMSDLGDEVSHLFSQAAPSGVTGELSRSIRAELIPDPERIKVEIHSEAEDDGYNYTRVTRFGHRRGIILPVHARKLRINWLKDYPPDKENVSYRDFVFAYHPATDWVEDVLPLADAEAEDTMGRVERAIEGRLLG